MASVPEISHKGPFWRKLVTTSWKSALCSSTRIRAVQVEAAVMEREQCWDYLFSLEHTLCVHIWVKGKGGTAKMQRLLKETESESRQTLALLPPAYSEFMSAWQAPHTLQAGAKEHRAQRPAAGCVTWRNHEVCWAHRRTPCSLLGLNSPWIQLLETCNLQPALSREKAFVAHHRKPVGQRTLINIFTSVWPITPCSQEHLYRAVKQGPSTTALFVTQPQQPWDCCTDNRTSAAGAPVLWEYLK